MIDFISCECVCCECLWQTMYVIVFNSIRRRELVRELQLSRLCPGKPHLWKITIYDSCLRSLEASLKQMHKRIYTHTYTYACTCIYMFVYLIFIGYIYPLFCYVCAITQANKQKYPRNTHSPSLLIHTTICYLPLFLAWVQLSPFAVIIKQIKYEIFI